MTAGRTLRRKQSGRRVAGYKRWGIGVGNEGAIQSQNSFLGNRLDYDAGSGSVLSSILLGTDLQYLLSIRSPSKIVSFMQRRID